MNHELIYNFVCSCFLFRYIIPKGLFILSRVYISRLTIGTETMKGPHSSGLQCNVLSDPLQTTYTATSHTRDRQVIYNTSLIHHKDPTTIKSKHHINFSLPQYTLRILSGSILRTQITYSFWPPPLLR